MLQVYADGSRSIDPDVLVLAGYLSTPERWAEFSDQWQRLLDMRSPHYRKLDYFKMSEMRSDADLERCGWFYRLIEDYALVAISVCVDVPLLRSLVISDAWWKSKLKGSPQAANPYFLAFDFIISGLAQHAATIGIDQPVDFIFDEESEKMQCLLGWNEFKSGIRSEWARFIGDTPIFRDDMTALPLQAADLWAWWVREWRVKGITDGIEHLRFHWKVSNKDFLRLHMDFSAMSSAERARRSAQPEFLAVTTYSDAPSSFVSLTKKK